MSETSSLPWKRIIAGAVITFLITIGSSIAINYIQTREAKLTYTLSNTIPFPLENREMGIYYTTLTNEGKSPAKGITWYIEISQAVIEQSEIYSDPASEILKTVNNNSITLEIPLLNPSESIEVSLLATSLARSLPFTPIISIRGEGIRGTLKKSTDIGGLFSSENIIIILIAITTAIPILTAILTKTEFKITIKGFKIIELGSEKLIGGGDTQDGVLAYLFGIQGSLKEMEYYNEKSEIAYWKESDRLGNLAETLTEDEVKKILFVLNNIPNIGSITDTSRGIVYYNIAKINAHLKNYDLVRDNLTEGEKYCKNIIRKRLEIDPIWGKVPEEYRSAR